MIHHILRNESDNQTWISLPCSSASSRKGIYITDEVYSRRLPAQYKAEAFNVFSQFYSSNHVYLYSITELQENVHVMYHIINHSLDLFHWIRKPPLCNYEQETKFHRDANGSICFFTISQYKNDNKKHFPLFACNIQVIQDMPDLRTVSFSYVS